MLAYFGFLTLEDQGKREKIQRRKTCHQFLDARYWFRYRAYPLSPHTLPCVAFFGSRHAERLEQFFFPYSEFIFQVVNQSFQGVVLDLIQIHFLDKIFGVFEPTEKWLDFGF